ncbi:MAG: nucleotidyl transferase AbiEii/AbiGii toxin family protein [Patescibacteria group bacterium]
MISLREEDILHKFQLLRLLTAVVDNPILSQNLYFKGGTCATMAGFLDRFSVDLDFDLKEGGDKISLRKQLEEVFKNTDFMIENDNSKTLFFVLKYQTPKKQRNTLKLSVYENVIKSNEYKAIHLLEIDRLVNCQTIETMFANKLVAPIDRYEKHEKIAGRDIYDIHFFFKAGYKFRNEVIEERTGLKIKEYIKKLITFIDEEVTQTLLTEDLNTLLPYDKFIKIRKSLKPETLIFLRSSI